MFSKKPVTLSFPSRDDGAARLAQARTAVLQAVANPYVGASGAAFLFLLTIVVLIMLVGDPKAGSPMVRLSLADAAKSGASVPGWREALAPERPGEAPLTPATFELSETPIAAPSIGGTAIITLPGGARLEASGRGGEPLATAPIAGLSQPGPGGGLLPVIASDGRTPALAYARPFTPNGKPRVALVIGGLGLNPTITRKAIDTLPPEVTLSFAPYAEGLQGWIDLARAAGHEVLLEAPMEPVDYPANDPGPYTLMAAGRPEETVKKLEWLLSRATGYFGLTNYLGSKFVASPGAMNTLAGALRQRGVAFVDDGSAARKGMGPPRASADRIIDDDLSAEAIERQLGMLETGAARSGAALGSGFAYPVTIDKAAAWAQGLSERGYQLAPASALTHR